MIKIGQIMDKETKGLGYLDTYKEIILNQTIGKGVHVFEAEVLEFEGDNPVNYVESKELEIDLDKLEGKTIRELFTESIG